MSDADDIHPAEASPADPSRADDRMQIRRAPKYSRFLIVGGALGAVVAFVLTGTRPVDPSVGYAPLLAFFSLFGVTGGVLAGAIVALVLDRVSLRRARAVEVEREVVEGLPVEGRIED